MTPIDRIASPRFKRTMPAREIADVLKPSAHERSVLPVDAHPALAAVAAASAYALGRLTGNVLIVAAIVVGIIALVRYSRRHPRRPARGGHHVPRPGGPYPPGHAPPPGIPAPAAVAWSDATAVGSAAVVTMWTIDTLTDLPETGDHHARLRALPYLTPAYAQQIRTEARQPAPPGVWHQWAAHGAYLRVDLTPGTGNAAADTPVAAYRNWVATTIPTGRDGWQAPPTRTFTAQVTLTRDNRDHPWQVATITTGTAPPRPPERT